MYIASLVVKRSGSHTMKMNYLSDLDWGVFLDFWSSLFIITCISYILAPIVQLWVSWHVFQLFSLIVFESFFSFLISVLLYHENELPFRFRLGSLSRFLILFIYNYMHFIHFSSYCTAMSQLTCISIIFTNCFWILFFFSDFSFVICFSLSYLVPASSPRTASAMGTIIAVVAVLLNHIERNAVVAMKPNINL